MLAGAHAEVYAILGFPQPVTAPLAGKEGDGCADDTTAVVVAVPRLHRRLYQEWRAAEEAYNTSPFDGSTPEGAKQVNRVNEIQEVALAIEPRTVEDMAFQILFADEGGYLASMSPVAKVLVEMAERIVSEAQVPPKPDAVPAARPSPILGLLREFYDLRRAASVYEMPEGANIDEELEARFYRRTDAIEKEIEAIASVTATDMAAKALISHYFGEHSCLWFEGDAFWKEARRLTGCYGVPWKEAWNPAWPAPQAEASASPMLDRTFALIEAHRAAEQACDDASTAADLVVLGRPATAEEMRAAEDALDALDAAAVALCEYAPPTLAGSRAKSARLLGCYLVESQEEIEGPIGALARSIARMVRADVTPAAESESEIPTRLHDWWNEWLRLDGARDEMSDEEHESALNVLMAVSDDVLAQPTFTAGGVAAKVIIDTRGGDFGLEPPLLAELYALSGLRRPPSDPDGASSLAPWESKNLQLFRKWDGIMARYAAEKDDDKSFDILGEAIAVTDEMQGVPCASGLDFAAKIVANINWVDKLSMYEIFSDALAADACDIMSRLGFSYREH